jgi:hypothetical protein
MLGLRNKLRMIVVFLMVFIGGCVEETKSNDIKNKYYESGDKRILHIDNDKFSEITVTRIEYEDEVCFLSSGWNTKGVTQAISCIKKRK